jgi:hypothetical protein
MTKFFRRSLVGLAVCFSLGAMSAQAATVAQWTFETSLPASAGSFAAEVGSGSASGFHAGASTYSSPAGNGSAHSFSSTNWAVGDYWQFQVSTAGNSGISLNWDQTSSNTGPRDFQLQYSTDGINFTNYGSIYAVLANAAPNAWSTTGTPNAASGFSFNLSGITALDNQATEYFRLVDASTISANGATVATAGTSRVDNFTVTAAVPEPETYAMLLAGLALLGFSARRRAK